MRGPAFMALPGAAKLDRRIWSWVRRILRKERERERERGDRVERVLKY